MSAQSIEVESVTQTSNQKKHNRLPGRIAYWGAYALLIILALIWIIPIAWAIDTSLKPESETTNIPISWLASHFTLDAFITTLTTSSLLSWLWNSTLTSAIISILTVLLASLAGFAISRIQFRGRNLVFWIFLAGIMVPSQILIVPLFTEMQTFHLVDTYWGIILPQIVSPVALFIFKQYFDGIPHELEEAAVLDGANSLRVYWQIWMPLAKPAIATVAVFTFVTSWNNFIWPFIVISSNDLMTLPVGLATVQTSFGIHYAQIMATAVLGGIPALIVFIFFQRQIVAGIAGTGIKG
jgi:multiple sugar transport system permease protein